MTSENLHAVTRLSVVLTRWDVNALGDDPITLGLEEKKNSSDVQRCGQVCLKHVTRHFWTHTSGLLVALLILLNRQLHHKIGEFQRSETLASLA